MKRKSASTTTWEGPDPLVGRIADLDEDGALELVRQRLDQGYDPFRLLKICQDGIREVGHRYETGRYFISGLIMGGEILRRAVEMVKPGFDLTPVDRCIGKIVLATVEGDIHDIGKNIAGALLSSQGFKVIDIGVDVPAGVIVEAVREHQPNVLGLSCLLTFAFESLNDAIEAVDAAGLRQGMPIVIGGGQLDSMVCDRVGADYWTTNAIDGVAWCVRATTGR